MEVRILLEYLGQSGILKEDRAIKLNNPIMIIEKGGAKAEQPNRRSQGRQSFKNEQFNYNYLVS